MIIMNPYRLNRQLKKLKRNLMGKLSYFREIPSSFRPMSRNLYKWILNQVQDDKITIRQLRSILHSLFLSLISYLLSLISTLTSFNYRRLLKPTFWRRQLRRLIRYYFNPARGRRRAISTILLLILVGAAGFRLFNAFKTQAWWNNSWAYRQRVTVSNSSGGTLTDFQATITVDTATLIAANKLQAGCADIRLTDLEGEIVPYWIESCNTTATKLWTKATYAAGSTYYYLYYGNPASEDASVHGDLIFDFFDDFNGSQIDTAKWAAIDATGISVSNGLLTATSTTGWIESVAAYDKSTNPIVETKVNHSTIPANGFSPLAFWTSTTDGWGSLIHPGSPMALYYRNNGDWGLIYNSTSVPSLIVKLTALSNNTASISYLNASTYANVVTSTGIANAVDNEKLRLNRRVDNSFAGQTMNASWDWVRVRKYAATEPTATFASEETHPDIRFGPVAHWKFDEGQAQEIEIPITQIEQQIELLTGTKVVYGSQIPIDNSLGMFEWDGSKYPNSTIYFEAVLANAGWYADAVASIFDSEGNLVSGAQVGRAGQSGYARVRSGPISLISGKKYTLRAYSQDGTGAYIRSARLIIIQSNSDKISATRSSIDIGESQKVPNFSYSPLNNKKIFHYESSKFSPNPTAYFEASLKSDYQPTIEHQIELTNDYYVTTSGSPQPTDNSLGMFEWDGSKYPNSAIYLEATLTNGGWHAHAVARLYDTDGNMVSGAQVARGGIAGWARVRSGPISLVSGKKYSLRVYSEDWTGAHIRNARLIIIQSASAKIENTRTNIDVGSLETTTSDSYAPLTKKKIYLYDANKFSPAPTIYLEASLKGRRQPAIEQQIEIINQSHNTTGATYSPTDNSLGLIEWDSSKYTGATPYFEAIIRTNDATAGRSARAALYDSAGNVVSGSEVTTLSTTFVRLRSNALTLADGQYTVRISNENASYIAYIQAARLIIQQTDTTKITDTQTHIDVGNNQTATSDSYLPLTDKKIYYYDADVFTPAPTAYFEATLSSDTALATAAAALYENGSTCTAQVSGSEVSVTGTDWGLVKSSSITLSDNTEYMVCILAENGTTAKIANARIILNQADTNGVTDLEIIHQQINTLNTQSNTTATNKDYRNRYNPELTTTQIAFAGGTFSHFFESTIKTTAGTGYARIINRTTGGVITNSQIETTGTDYSRVRSGTITANLPSWPSTTAAQEMDSQIWNSATNTTSVSTSSIIIQVSGLSTTGAGIASVALYENGATCTNKVNGSDVDLSSVDPGVWNLVRSNAITLTDDAEYMVCLKTPNGTGHIANARILLDQSDTNGITDLEIIHQGVNGIWSTTGTGPGGLVTYFAFNPGLELSQQSFSGGNVAFQFESTIKTTGGTGYARISNGLGEVSTTSTDYARARSGDITNSLPSWPTTMAATQYDIQIWNSNGSTTSITKAGLVIQVSGLPNTGSNTVSAALYENGTSCQTEVPGSEVTITSSTWSHVRSGAIQLTSGKDYMTCIKTSNSNAKIANAKIILDQFDKDGIKATESYYQYITALTTTTSSSYGSLTMQNYFNPTNFTWFGPNINKTQAYFESTLKTNSGTAYSRMSTGIGEVSTANTDYQRARSAAISASLPTTAQEIDAQIRNSGSNTTSVSNSWLILQNNPTLPAATRDYASNIFHGNISGDIVWKPETDCVEGKCLAFNGTNSFITAKDASGLKPSVFTISAWVNVPDITKTMSLISKNTTSGYQLGFNLSDCPTNSFCFVSRVGSTTHNVSVPTTAFPINRWHYVAATFDGNTMKLYINGQEASSQAAAGSVTYTTNPLCIGAATLATSCSGSLFDGKIDEVKLFPFVKSADDILIDYNLNAGSVMGDTFPKDNLDNNLVLRWNLDESAAGTCAGGADACDSAGFSNHGTHQNSPSATAGKFGSALSLDGSGARATVSSTNGLNPFDNNWTKKVPITITNNVAAILTDYQIRIPVKYDADMNSDFSDIRFTANSGQLLPYWLETKIDGLSAVFWVKMDKIPSSGTANLNMYFGNPVAASASNGENTFIFFDDFNDNSIDTVKWTKNDQGTNHISESGGKLRFQTGTGAWNQSIYGNVTHPRQDLSMDWDYRPIALGHIMMGWHDSGSGLSYTDLPYSFYENSNTYQYFYEDGNSRGNTSDRFYTNNLYKMQLKMRASGGAYYQYSIDGGNTWATSYTTTYSTETNLRPGFAYHGGNQEVDNVRVRKTAATEPAVTIAVAQASAQTFTYTGNDQTFQVPAGITSVTAKLWGGGGGNGNVGGWSYGYPGGSGGFTIGNIAVTPGQTLTVMVGAAGNHGSVGNQSSNYGGGGPNCGGTDCQYGGQGGGRSAIRVGVDDILTAGGGGGGGSTYSNVEFMGGGGGGGTDGQTGFSGSSSGVGGGGGTQVSGGIAGVGNNTGATAGSQYLGGRPISPYSYGGSGGGGWYGGGGGAYNGGNIMGGGGGGSGYIGGAGVSNAAMVAATGTIPGNAHDPDRSTAGNPGSAGKVKLTWAGTTIYAAGPSQLSPSSMTASAWAYPQTVDTSHRTILARGSANDTNGYDWSMYLDGDNSGKVKFTSDGSIFGTSQTTLSTNEWHNLTMVVNGNQTTLYINGQPDTVITNAGYLPGAGAISLGADADAARPFHGKLDEFRIYNIALSSQQVQELYQWTPGPLAHYTLDEGSGSEAHDRVGYHYSATLENGASWATGQYGYGVKLDGTNDHLSVANTIPSVRSLSFWVRPEANTGGLISLNATSYVTLNSGTITTTGITAPTIYVNNQVQSSLTLNQWQYVTITTATPIEASALTFGLANGSYLNGSLDDIRLFDYPLNQDEIIRYQNAGHPLGGSPISSSVLHWKLDEGHDATAHNSGSAKSAYNGTITSGTWTTQGKLGKALELTASTSVAATITDPGSAHTLSLWLYPTTSAASKTIITTNKLTTDSSSRPVYGSCVGTALPLNQWTHLAVISNGSTSCAIYQNGSQTAVNTTGVTFGTTFNLGNSSFTGRIDEVKLYTAALTARQIAIDANAGSGMTAGVIDSVPDRGFNLPQPIGLWNLNENAGTTAKDTSGNNRHGTLSGTGTHWATGKVGSALRFNGTDDQLAVSASISGIQTLSFWMNPATGTTPVLTLSGTAAISISSNTLSTTIGSATIYVNGSASTTITPNAWQHITITTTSPITADAITIGKIGTSYYTGLLDHLVMYSQALTPTQISYSHNQGAPLLHFKLDDCHGSSARNAGSLTGQQLSLSIGAAGTNTSPGVCNTSIATSAWDNGKSGQIGAASI
jgi:hypothetical protein